MIYQLRIYEIFEHNKASPCGKRGRSIAPNLFTC